MSPQDTRSAIMDAAQGLIQRQGVNGMSYQHISDAVGIQKASIHYHFPSKEDLIEALLDRFSMQFDGELRRLDASAGTTAEQFRAYVALFEQTFFEGDAVCLYGMLGAELASLSPTSASRIGAFYRRNVGWLEQTLTRGRAEGSLQFTGEPATVAFMIFSLLEGGMLVARADQGPEQYRALTREVLTLLGIEHGPTQTSAESAA